MSKILLKSAVIIFLPLLCQGKNLASGASGGNPGSKPESLGVAEENGDSLGGVNLPGNGPDGGPRFKLQTELRVHPGLTLVEIRRGVVPDGSEKEETSPGRKPLPCLGRLVRKHPEDENENRPGDDSVGDEFRVFLICYSDAPRGAFDNYLGPDEWFRSFFPGFVAYSDADPGDESYQPGTDPVSDGYYDEIEVEPYSESE